MAIRILRRRKITATDRIAYALGAIERDLYTIVGYMKASESRQEIFASVFSGLTPMITNFVAEKLGPKHPVQPYIPFAMRPPKRSHKAKK